MKNVLQNSRKNNLDQKNNCFVKYSILTQIILGIIFSILNCVVGILRQEGLPLYVDCIFTVSASFFGVPCGMICGILLHLISIFLFGHPYSEIIFILCSYSVVFVIRFYFRDKQKPNYLDLFILSFFLALLISLEGALLFAIAYKLFSYTEMIQSKYFTYILIRQNFSLLVSSFLSRVPINLIDKTISVFVGYGTFILTQKLIKKL